MMRKTPIAVSVALVCASTCAQALEYGVVVSTESEYTSNTARTEYNEIEEWIHSPGVEVTAEHEGADYELEIDYSFHREIFEEDLYDDQNIAVGNASLNWRVLPERLDFVVDHARTQTAVRAISAVTPDNRQESTTTSAGPVLHFRGFGNDEIELQYQWIDRGAEDSDVDSTTHDTSARYIYAPSAANSITFEAAHRRVQYDNGFIPDIEYNLATIGWTRTSADVTLELVAGYNRTERSNNRDDVNGGIGSAEVNWQITSATNLVFEAARELRDRSETLSSGAFADDLDFSVSSDLGELFTNDRASFAVEHAFNSTTALTATLSYDEEDYEDSLRDRESLSTIVSFSRALNPRTTFRLALRQENQDFTDQDEEVDLYAARADLDRTFGPRLTVGLSFEYEERDSNAIGPTANYDEWAAFLRLDYQLVGRR